MTPKFIAVALLVLAPLPVSSALPAPPPTRVAATAQERAVEDLVLAFREHVGEKGLEDSDAIGVIDELLQGWEDYNPKQRKSVVKELGKSLKAKRRELADGVPNDGLFQAVAIALGEMGDENAAKELESWVDHKTHRKNLMLRRQLILALGRTKQPSGVDPLLDLISHNEPIVQAAACEALGDYEGAEEKVRKKIFEKVLKLLTPMHAAVQIDSGVDPILRERYDTVAGPMITTLRRLSGHQERDPQEFTRWWNKNKREDWTTGG